MSEIAKQMVGRWPGVLAALGVDEKVLSGRNGPCPSCGGKDRFRFTNHEDSGLWICNHCGSGNGFRLLDLVFGWDFPTAAKEIEGVIGKVNPVVTDPKLKLENAKRRLNKIRTTKPSEATVNYLRGRGLIVPPGIRSSTLPYYDDDGKQLGRFDAMLGRVVSPTGQPVTYHVTYLQDGKKAPVPKPKKMMPLAGPHKGAAIRLFPIAKHIGVAEGIETAIAAHMRFALPVWATTSSGFLRNFIPPEGVETITIFGDNDKSFGGQEAAYTLAFRLQRDYEVRVLIPDEVGDWDDVLKQNTNASAKAHP